MADALNCPNCGAPLRPSLHSPLALCLYCGSSVRLQADESSSPVVDATLDENELARLKQLLLDGGREEAVRLYVQMSGADETAARMAVSGLGRQISLDIIRSQNLTPYGAWMVTLWSLLLLASLAAAALQRLHLLVALALAAYAGFNMALFLPALRTSLRYLRAPVAPAVTLKLSPVAWRGWAAKRCIRCSPCSKCSRGRASPFRRKCSCRCASKTWGARRPAPFCR
jgi:hypothetical protein